MRKLKSAGSIFVFISTVVLGGACQKLPQPRNVEALPSYSPYASGQGSTRSTSGTYGPPKTLATIKNPGVVESSGLVASRTTPGVYWTHNDSGDGPFLYALDAGGESHGVWRMTGAEARDWEDIATGPGPQRGKPYLYVGDIGDNSALRAEIVVYRIPEPLATAADTQSSKRKPRLTETAEAIRLRYPEGHHDAEALLINPSLGTLYIVTKVPFGDVTVYAAAAPLNTSAVTTLKPIGELHVPSIFGGMITGGDISPDGRRVVLCDYLQAYELVLPRSSAKFDEIWKQPLAKIDLGRRRQGEAVAYRLDGKALLATSEGRASPLIQAVRQ